MEQYIQLIFRLTGETIRLSRNETHAELSMYGQVILSDTQDKVLQFLKGWLMGICISKMEDFLNIEASLIQILGE